MPFALQIAAEVERQAAAEAARLEEAAKAAEAEAARYESKQKQLQQKLVKAAEEQEQMQQQKQELAVSRVQCVQSSVSCAGHCHGNFCLLVSDQLCCWQLSIMQWHGPADNQGCTSQAVYTASNKPA